MSKNTKHLEEHFQSILISFGIADSFEREYIFINKLVRQLDERFEHMQDWRFDFADIKNRIAVEIDGGIWRGRSGAHTSPAGKIRDNQKGNAATILGWRLLRYSTKDDMSDFIRDYGLILQSQQQGNGNG